MSLSVAFLVFQLVYGGTMPVGRNVDLIDGPA